MMADCGDDHLIRWVAMKRRRQLATIDENIRGDLRDEQARL